MSDLLFVRELAADHDLVLGFAADGSPAWALDLDTGVQWWFSGGDRAQVRAAVAAQWSSFATMPVTAAARDGGPHPALELDRRAAPAPRPAEPVRRRRPWWDEVATRFLALSVRARLVVAAAVVLVGVVVAPWLAGFLLAGHASSRGIGDGPENVPVVAVDGSRCDIRGEVSHDSAGRVLVCVAPSRALSYELVWRATT